MSNDNTRRAEFLAYFEKHIRSRQVLMDGGVSKGRVTQYFDPDEPFGERAAIGIENRLKLERGTMFPSLKTAAPPETTKLFLSGLIPVVGSAQLGDDGHFCEIERPTGRSDGYIMWSSSDPKAYALRCKGENMKPRLHHHEYIAVEPSHPIAPGDEVVVTAVDGRVIVKQLAYRRDGLVHLDSVNESHPRISISETEILVMHYITGIAKSSMWKPNP